MIKKNFFIIFVLLIIIFWSIYFLNRDLLSLNNFFINLSYINNFINENFILSFLIYIFSYCLLIICNFPAASLLSMVGGFLFGTWFGGIGIIFGATLGSVIIFLIAKSYFYNFIKKKILNKYKSIENFFYKNDLELMFLIRIIPGVPFFLQNLILAGLGANNFKFIYTTFLGLAPWAFIFASVGESLEKIFIKEQKLSLEFFMKIEYIIPLTLSLIIVTLIKKFKKNN